MTTTLRYAWLTPQPTQARRFVMTPHGRGYVWDGTPLDEQIRRDRIAVCFGDGQPARYYTRSEISFIEEQAR